MKNKFISNALDKIKDIAEEHSIDDIASECNDIETEVENMEDDLERAQLQEAEAQSETESDREDKKSLEDTLEAVGIIPENLYDNQKAEVLKRLYDNLTLPEIETLEARTVSEFKENKKNYKF